MTFLQKYTRKKTLKIHVAVCHEFLCLITNIATDAIKAVIRMVNMKIRKLKKNNVKGSRIFCVVAM